MVRNAHSESCSVVVTSHWESQNGKAKSKAENSKFYILHYVLHSFFSVFIILLEVREAVSDAIFKTNYYFLSIN